MRIEEYLALRPTLYHLTAASNLPRIERVGALEPAAVLLKRAGRDEYLQRRREASLTVIVDDERINIRDQTPLCEGHIALEGMTFAEFVAHVNTHVFFWPGDCIQPIRQGRSHFERYKKKGEVCVVLRIDAAALLRTNAGVEPRFCRYNSGAPRTVNRKKSPRGLMTYVPCERFMYPRWEVAELVFPSAISLPQGEWESRPLSEFTNSGGH